MPQAMWYSQKKKKKKIAKDNFSKSLVDEESSCQVRVFVGSLGSREYEQLLEFWFVVV